MGHGQRLGNDQALPARQGLTAIDDHAAGRDGWGPLMNRSLGPGNFGLADGWTPIFPTKDGLWPAAVEAFFDDIDFITATRSVLVGYPLIGIRIQIPIALVDAPNRCRCVLENCNLGFSFSIPCRLRAH